MSEIKATAQQRAAAQDRGGALLLAAGAGSGKTKVLVDRLMTYLTDPTDPADLDEFLIITYTRAAASELRAKIAARLAQAIADAPQDRHLQRQLTRVYCAQISTVHSFCQTILRQYAAEAALSADFRVADEQQAAALRAQTLKEVLSELYEQLDEQPDFAAMIDTLGYGRDDRRLLALAEESYSVMRCQVDPEAWRRACLAAYDLPQGIAAEDTVWGAYFLQERTHVLQQADALLQTAQTLCSREEKLAEKCAPVLEKNRESLRALLAQQTWDGCRAKLVTSFGAMRPPANAEHTDRVKALRKQAWELVKQVQSCFYADSARVVDDLRASVPALRGLLALLKAFDERFTQEKRRRHLLDFSDLEHCMIALLTQKGSGAPTAAAKSIAAGYREILIDEYQDSNAVQECIFQAVSRGGQNVFMVGDVKQSIYRFRLADPMIFLKKYESYPLCGEQAPGAPRKLLLSQNFRSRPQILAAVNDVFSLVMNRDSGELDYTEAEALHPGAQFPPLDEPLVELHCLNYQDDDDESGDKTGAEAEYVAARIEQLLLGGAQVTENGALRPARPSDIVILLRSPGMIAGVYQQALQARGIACDAGVGTDLLQTAQVEILVQLLQIVDNPHRDIPLAAAMASPVFAFSPEELALLRAENRSGDLYSCLCACRAPSEKLRAFTAWLEQMRLESRRAPLRELVGTIIDSSGLEQIFAALPDGAQRCADLAAFEAFVETNAQTELRSLSQLVALLEQLSQRGAQLPAPSAPVRNDAVRIMSIHRSKGLEFPIVILADLARKMNLQDNQAAVLTDEALLLGANVVDLASRSYYPGLARTAIMRRKTQKTVSEELRVLYVAMTRAKERLIMTSCAARYDSRLQKLRQLLCVPLAPCVSAGARRLDEWVLLAALCRTESGALFARCGPCEYSRVHDDTWLVRMEDVTPAKPAARGSAPQQPLYQQPLDKGELARCASFTYPHAAATALPSKLTATQLKGRTLDQEAAEQTVSLPQTHRAWRAPQFLRDRPLTGREKGNATHLFMQFVRYEACTTQDGVRQELARLQAQRFLTPQQAQAVDEAAILRLFSSELGARILHAQQLRREFKFSIFTDAAQIDPRAAGEAVMLQGVVDCFWQEPEGLVILDFKTDHISGDLAEKAARYEPQLRAYAMALSRIYEQPVKQTLLYFFSANQAVTL